MRLSATCCVGLGAAVMLAGGSGAARADDQDDPLGNDVAVGAAVVVPVEGWADVAGLGLGGTVLVRMPLSRLTTVTVRGGGIGHLTVTAQGREIGLLQVPLLGGARREVARRGAVGGFLAGEVGLVVARTAVTLAGVSEADTEARFASALAAGIEVGRVEVTAGVWLGDLTDLDHAVGYFATAGVRVARW